MQSRNESNIKGIDVSKWDGEIDFNKVKASGIQIVYMKATEGVGYIDPYFEKNYDNAKAVGLKVGFYHYFTPKNEDDTRAEVKAFTDAISGKDVDCYLALDNEDNKGIDKDTLSRLSKIWLDEVKAVTGKEVVLYTYTDFARNHLTSLLKDYPLWIAHYGVNTPGNNPIWDSWVGFQYSSSGTVDGINTRCDMNEFTNGILLNKYVSPQVNNKVIDIQTLCNNIGIRDKNGNALVVDGKPGPLTQSAVVNLPVLKQGSNNAAAIKVMQAIVGTGVDGSFGPKTLAAVKSWQQSHGLVVDGSVGPKTWNSLLTA